MRESEYWLELFDEADSGDPMEPDEPPLTEDDAIPANPDNESGWEKLYAERAPWNTLLYAPHLERPPYSTGRVAMVYGRRYGMKVRIARFENCYGPTEDGERT